MQWEFKKYFIIDDIVVVFLRMRFTCRNHVDSEGIRLVVNSGVGEDDTN